MTESKPRLLINCATGDLDLFEQVASAATILAERYSVRMVVSHLAQRKTHELRDPGDPYLQFSVNFPGLFDFVVPGALECHVEPQHVRANLAVLEAKMAILRRVGVGGAFFGREPVYAREPLYEEHPEWRGPRVDHPRRSRTALFAMCLHHPEVQAMYRGATASLTRRFPDLDTFYWWTNDSGAGFCWYPELYSGPNGPEGCRRQGALPAMAAFHAAILDGAREAGAAQPLSITAHSRIWDERVMPPGSHYYPMDRPASGKSAVRSLRSDLSLTYPVRYLWDPLRRLEQTDALREPDPVAVVCWLSDVYHRTHVDPGTVRRIFALWHLATEQPQSTKRLPDRLALLTDYAAAEFGPHAAADVVDGWIGLHAAFETQLNNPYPRPRTTFLSTYGPLAHRWLTRPMVALPGELSREEESYFLPHVFAVGNEARRTNLLDHSGHPAADAAEDYRLRSNYFDRLTGDLVAAAACFERAAASAGQEASGDLLATARASRMMACIWRTCRNWLEFGVSLGQGTERFEEPRAAVRSETERERAEAYHRRLFGILRSELDNMLALEELLRQDDADGAMALVRGALPADEDSFTLSPDLPAQLARKREIMLSRWQDVTRLVPRDRA